ncbi:hypothetical protein [Roseateles sp.]|uniref:hypothetical protein n=1 Tax=Roseateles sp. TaxID=1971397 RepID=UPI003BA9AB95
MTPSFRPVRKPPADQTTNLPPAELDISALYFSELDTVLRAMVGPATLMAATFAALLPLASVTSPLCARCIGL